MVATGINKGFKKINKIRPPTPIILYSVSLSLPSWQFSSVPCPLLLRDPPLTCYPFRQSLARASPPAYSLYHNHKYHDYPSYSLCFVWCNKINNNKKKVREREREKLICVIIN